VKETYKYLHSQLLQWVEKFVSDLQHCGCATKIAYRRQLHEFVAAMVKATSVNRIPFTYTATMFKEWLRDLSKYFAVVTLQARAVPVSKFLDYLEQKGVLKNNPVQQLLRKYPREGLRGIVRVVVAGTPHLCLKDLKIHRPATSKLWPTIQMFLAHERSLGKAYSSEETQLRRFDKFLHTNFPATIALSAHIVEKWRSLLSQCSPAYRYENFLLIRKFCKYQRRLDPHAYVPASDVVSCKGHFVPHIYSPSEITTLLNAASRLKPLNYSISRPKMMYTMLTLLYTSGLRISEAVKLEIRDIDWGEQSLHIRETKFYKSRIVPLSTTAFAVLKDYLQICYTYGLGKDSPIFMNLRTKMPYSSAHFRDLFKRLLKCAGLYRPGRGLPRLHDFRHTFAVRRLEQWYQQNADVQSKLVLLSTYMGHSGLLGTQKYLTMTPELLRQASGRFNKYYHRQ
jgi:site-specific recombinase XerD